MREGEKDADKLNVDAHFIMFFYESDIGKVL